METFNECTLLFLTYLMWCFSDFVAEPETRNSLGFWFIAINLSNVAVHLTLMAFKSIRRSIRKCKQKKLRKKSADAYKAQLAKQKLQAAIRYEQMEDN